MLFGRLPSIVVRPLEPCSCCGHNVLVVNEPVNPKRPMNAKLALPHGFTVSLAMKYANTVEELLGLAVETMTDSLDASQED